jgi:hypothetical protein
MWDKGEAPAVLTYSSLDLHPLAFRRKGLSYASSKTWEQAPRTAQKDIEAGVRLSRH